MLQFICLQTPAKAEGDVSGKKIEDSSAADGQDYRLRTSPTTKLMRDPPETKLITEPSEDSLFIGTLNMEVKMTISCLQIFKSI